MDFCSEVFNTFNHVIINTGHWYSGHVAPNKGDIVDSSSIILTIYSKRQNEMYTQIYTVQLLLVRTVLPYMYIYVLYIRMYIFRLMHTLLLDTNMHHVHKKMHNILQENILTTQHRCSTQGFSQHTAPYVCTACTVCIFSEKKYICYDQQLNTCVSVIPTQCGRNVTIPTIHHMCIMYVCSLSLEFDLAGRYL